MKKKYLVLAVLALCSLLANAQSEEEELSLDDDTNFSADAATETNGAPSMDVPPPLPEISNSEVNSDDNAEPLDPLDVIEQSQKQSGNIEAPSVPEFKELSEPTSDAPAAVSAGSEPVTEPVAPPVEEAPKDVKPSLVKKNSSKNKKQVARTPDDPDRDRELRFHRIYSKYNQSPTPTETWETVLGERRSEVYSVQSGDTLWDVSKTLFGDPQYWPKVWSLNSGKVLNPHEINPQLQIQFFPGSQGDVPTLQVTDQKTTPSEFIFVEREHEGKVVQEKLTLSSRSKPVLKMLPDSLPMYRYKSLEPQAPIEVDTKKITFESPQVPLSYYLADKPVSGIGRIVETEMGLGSATEHQYVIVKLNPNVSPGLFQVAITKEVIPTSLTKDRRSFLVEVQGEVETLEVVNSKENLYRAMVRTSLSLVQVGATLQEGRMKLIPTNMGEVTSSAKARIIGAEFSARRDFVAASSFVFLDNSRGELNEGDVLSIYANPKIRNQKTQIIEGARVIGKVRIVHLDGPYATGYVLSSEDVILMGDSVGAAPVKFN